MERDKKCEMEDPDSGARPFLSDRLGGPNSFFTTSSSKETSFRMRSRQSTISAVGGPSHPDSTSGNHQDQTLSNTFFFFFFFWGGATSF